MDIDDNFLIAGARTATKLPGKKLDNERLEIDKVFSLESFEKFICRGADFDQLKDWSRCGELDKAQCRFNIWRIYLNLIPKNNEEGIRAAISKQREEYGLEMEKYKVSKTASNDVAVVNPLSKNTNNPWNSFFEDSELRNTIKKDVERTYQDREFFQKIKIKNILNNVLFLWSKRNSHISYRQGMNEIAAIVTFVYFTEAFNSSTDDFKVHEKKDGVSEFFKFLNDENQAEADIFTVFNKIMSVGQLDMFKSGNEDPLKKKLIIDSGSGTGGIIETSKLIFDNYLSNIDKELYRHMKGLAVEPHIFLLRWIRCMTTREFHLLDSIKIWDSVFLEYNESQISQKSNSFRFLHYISCAELIKSFKVLDKSDQTMCLQRLLKYPPVESVGNIISLGWKYKADIEKLQNEVKKTEDNKDTVPAASDIKTTSNPLFQEFKTSSGINLLAAGGRPTEVKIKEVGNNQTRVAANPPQQILEKERPQLLSKSPQTGAETKITAKETNESKLEESVKEKLTSSSEKIEKFLQKFENSQSESISRTELSEALLALKEAKDLINESLTDFSNLNESLKKNEALQKKEKSLDPLSKKVLF